MTAWVLGFDDIEAASPDQVGGKGAGLAALARLPGVSVPPGFCVTTAAFARWRAPDGPVPGDVAAAVVERLARLPGPVAVRSSAVGEDGAAASFAGLHDSFLGVAGAEAVLAAIVACWRSASSSRAVAYRQARGLPAAPMAVVVQRMVAPIAAGVLFTADPVSGHRRVARVEAVAGLAEGLVAGRVQPAGYRVRGDAVEADDAAARALLTDAQVLALVTLGREVEAAFGGPQDIEWCLDAAGFHLVQSRPITTLFPVPVEADAAPRVYVSVGHQQMMTDAMAPLGLSLFQRVALRPMAAAGGRLFVDVAPALAAPSSRAALLGALGRSDPLIGAALGRVPPGFVPARPDGPPPPAPPPAPPDAAVVDALVARTADSTAALAADLAGLAGPAVFARIRADVPVLQAELLASHPAIMAGMEAAWWLNDHLAAWLGVQAAADVLGRSGPPSVTTALGLGLLDVADALRPWPAVVAHLRAADPDDAHALDALAQVPGGPQAVAALTAWLDAYGARCPGEIDVTRPRWRERPGALFAAILSHVEHFEPGEAARRRARGVAQAEALEAEVLARLAPRGEAVVAEVRAQIARLRAFSGFRESPKFGLIQRLWLYKQALWREAARLVAAGALARVEDARWLTLDELEAAASGEPVDPARLARREAAHRDHQALRGPRVMTSEGEVLDQASDRADLPPGALPGLGVSVGVVEGRARVVLDPTTATLAPGDILVTAGTDPGWTPHFLVAAALVTEVGGLMTHGAVIARELGLPAVVGVVGATERIRDGQRLRVDGTSGAVVPLPDAAG